MNATLQAASAPKVLVLLATHNAQDWIDEQLGSLAAQQGVQVSVLASDDASSDGTLERLATWRDRLRLAILPPTTQRLGNANRNFLRLIREAAISADIDFVALSDHDDIWLPDKLVRAIQVLRAQAADAYSSNVTAFWPDGRERLLRKSGVQRAHDYLLESAGPGCTFVWPRERFLELQAWVQSESERLQDVKVHDWLIYAWARLRGWHWHIDPESHMRYRQHARNEVGANAGWASARKRWQQVRRGDYRRDILAMAAAVGDQSKITRWLTRLHWTDRLRLVGAAPTCRRRPHEAAAWALLCLLMKKDTP